MTATCADGFECATARVPLDHDDPRGAGIDLAVIRHRTDDRARIASTGDPAMPYEGSRAMARSLARAEPLTVDRYGHTVLADPGDCAARHEARYLVDGVLPAPGTVCAPTRPPFGG